MAKTPRRSRDDTPHRPPAHAGSESAAPRIPGWLPWTLFAVVGLALFRAFVFSDAMLVGGDTLSLGYVARAFYANALADGVFPLWAPQILGGTPFIAALSGGDSLYPPSLALLMILDPHRALGWKLVLHVIAAGLLMFAWARALGASRAAALVAGTGYMLSPMLIGFVAPGHDGKLFVMSLAPLMFWAVERFLARARPTAGGFAAIGLVVTLVISTTHFQMAWFLFMAVGCYAFFRTVQIARGTDRGVDPDGEGEGEGAPDAGSGDASRADGTGLRLAPAGARFGLFLAASVAGAAGAAVQLLPAVEYVTEFSRRTQTTGEDAGERGLAWSSSFSIHPEEAMSLLVPQFAGNNAGGAAWAEGTYWGRNGFKDNHENAGLVVLLLAAVAFAGGRRRGVRWFMAGLGAVAFLFAMGTHTPVWRIFYEVVPGIRLFRAPSQAMFLFSFAAATLAALGVDRILRAAREDRDEGWTPVMRVLAGGTGLMGLVALLMASGAVTTVWTTTIWPEMGAQRAQLLEVLQPFWVQGAFAGVVLTGTLAGVVWAVRRGTLAAPALVAAACALIVVDGFRVNHVFIETMDFYAWSQPDPNMRALLDRERGSDEPYRLLSFVREGQDVAPALHGIELAAGHHPNDLARYRELIGMVGSGDPQNLYQYNIRRILNVGYILWPDYERGPAPEGPVLSRTQLAGGQVYQTLLVDNGLPRARLVGQAVVKSDNEAVPYILSPGHDPEVEAVLAEGSPEVALAGHPVQGSVDWVERGPNRLVLDVETDGPALLVVADNWFPAWRATVNGDEAPVLRAYHTLRAVPVPEGRSQVVMTYRSATLARSAWISALVLLGLAATATWSAVRGRLGRRSDAPEAP